MILKIAFRNTLRQKRRTVLTALTMFGGFTLAAISIGWSDGSYANIINLFTRNRLGHIQIHSKGYLDKPSLYNTINNYGEVSSTLRSVKEVAAWAPRLYAAGLASTNEKSTAVQVIGIDPGLENNTTLFDKKIVQGHSFSAQPSRQAVLGKGLAEILNAAAGDEVVIVSQAADGSIANDLYTVAGIVETGDVMSDRMALYLHIADAQEFFVLENRIHEIAVIISNIDRVAKTAENIQSALDNPELSVAPWQEFARSFYEAMRTDQEGMWVMIFVIILIVAVGVLNTVLMAVLERTREYGVLKAVGTKPFQIFWQILAEVNLIALASCIIGAGLSLLINYLLSKHGIPMPISITYGGVEFKALYSEINIRSFTIPALSVFFSASLISIFPAIRAARIKPARAMRIH